MTIIYEFRDTSDDNKISLDQLLDMILQNEDGDTIRVWLYSAGGYWKGNLQVQFYDGYIGFNANKNYDYTSIHNMIICETPANNNALIYALAGTLYTLFWRDK